MLDARNARAAAMAATAWLFAAGGVATAQKMVRPETYPEGFVIVVEDQSKTANQDKPIYFAGAVNAWNPGDAQYVLTPRSDLRWQIIFPANKLSPGSEFKFTLGAWNSVELDPEGQEIANRQLPEVDVSRLGPGERPIIELSVPRFRSGATSFVIAEEYRPLSAGSGTLKRMQVAGGAGRAAGAMRDLLVWLPPGYESSGARTYPVLYMMDGQNLFGTAHGAAAEWRLDETAGALVSAGVIEPVVVVGVPSIAAARADEYTPPGARLPAGMDAEPAADAQLAWLNSQVIPRVERAFRVRTDREGVAIGGASLGGSFALYAAAKMPQTFGKVLAESPALSVLPRNFDRVLVGVAREAGLRTRIFVGMGGAEQIDGSDFFDAASGKHVKAVREFEREVSGHHEVSAVVVPRHGHDERAWAERLPGALSFLFPAGGGEDAGAAAAPSNPAMAEGVRPESLEQGFTLVVEDASGKASAERPVYLASNHGGWNAQDASTVLTRRADGLWAITLKKPTDANPLEFKFTLGGWERAELSPNGENVENRRLPLVPATAVTSGEPPEIRFVVPRFGEPEAATLRRDWRPDAGPGVVGRIERLEVRGGGADVGVGAGMTRELLVWLPEGYGEGANAGRRYPVVYLMDGQNLFRAPPGGGGEWRVDETATRLIATGEIPPTVIVGVPHSGRGRMSEYLPFAAIPGVEPTGDAFAAWFVSVVMPAVEEAFAVSTAPAETVVGGASLGAVISARIVAEAPGRFGGVILESVGMLGEEGAEMGAHRRSVRAGPARVWVGMGGREVMAGDGGHARNAAYRAWARRIAAVIGDGRTAEGGSPEVALRVDAMATHHERAWAERFGGALGFVVGG